MREKWFVITKSGDYRQLGERYGVSPIVARIMRNRGIVEDSDAAAFLDTSIESMHDAKCMKDCERLVDFLIEKINTKKKIRVIGDYDIDGVCSTYILLKGLSHAGADVDHVIPHRVKDGYGLNENLIRNAYDEGVDTIITCDNGIAALSEIKLAEELGMTVLVTDHHQVPYHEENGEKVEDFVPAEAIVDPHRSDDEYPYSMLCGAGVAYKVIEVLYDALDMESPEKMDFFEIAAFATIGDVMPLTGENRIFVKNGLKKLQSTSNIGLQALIGLNGLDGKELSPYHVGFVLGPCMNATGRLDSAENALRLLNASDRDEAHDYAVMLKEMNDSRKALTEKSVKEAIEIAESDQYQSDRVLVILLEECHESIAGIVAGKVRERTGKPTFILTRGQLSDGSECAKGSGRSIEEYNMHDEMTRISDVFLKFGGHAMAAGLSLSLDKVDEFRQRLNENCNLTEDDLALKVHIDMVMPLGYVNFALVDELKVLEPFGTANEKPLFAAKDVYIHDGKILGANRNVYKCIAEDSSGAMIDAIYFGDAEGFSEYVASHEKIAITYCPDVNVFRGNTTLQINIKNYQ
ncbi:MAG: single-stranded-DNA-specific exonuclease RecJ [Lachnospiraceae bacterium]|nr:single-stranded-DNA-specific exonuclease RecJ [Lachnospiraceae bacterium]